MYEHRIRLMQSVWMVVEVPDYHLRQFEVRRLFGNTRLRGIIVAVAHPIGEVPERERIRDAL